MKKLTKILLVMLLILCCVMAFVACNKSDEDADDVATDGNDNGGNNNSQPASDIVYSYAQAGTTYTLTVAPDWTSAKFVVADKSGFFSETTTIKTTLAKQNDSIYDVTVSDFSYSATKFGQAIESESDWEIEPGQDVGQVYKINDDAIYLPMIEGGGILHTSSFQGILLSNVRVRYGGNYDMYFVKGMEAEDIQEYIEYSFNYFDANGNLNYIEPEASDVTIDVSNAGATTLTIKYNGNNYTFSAYVCENQEEMMNMLGVGASSYEEFYVGLDGNGSALTTATADEMKSQIYSAWLYTNGPSVQLNKEDVTVTMPENPVSGNEYPVVFSITYQDKTYTYSKDIFFYSQEDAAKIRSMEISEYSYGSEDRFFTNYDYYSVDTYYVAKGTQITEVIVKEELYNGSSTIVYDMAVSGYDKDAVGLQKVTLGTNQGSTYFYVYDPENVPVVYLNSRGYVYKKADGSYDYSNLKVYKELANGSQEEIDLSTLNKQGSAISLSVTYNGLEGIFSEYCKEKSPTDIISVTVTGTVTFNANTHESDYSNLVATGHCVDGSTTTVAGATYICHDWLNENSTEIDIGVRVPDEHGYYYATVAVTIVGKEEQE